MSQFPTARRPAPLGPRAARALTAELARHGGPKTGLVVGGAAAVVNAAIDALLPDDRLTVVTDSLLVRDAIVAQGRWVAERVRVVESLGQADPADVVILAEPVTGTAEEVRARLKDLGKLINPGGVLSVAVVATAQPDRAAVGMRTHFAHCGEPLPHPPGQSPFHIKGEFYRQLADVVTYHDQKSEGALTRESCSAHRGFTASASGAP